MAVPRQIDVTNLKKPSSLEIDEQLFETFEHPIKENKYVGKRGLSHFLDDLSKKKVLLPSQFELKFNYESPNSANGTIFKTITNNSESINLLTCFATDINVPTIRHNFTEIFFHGQSIELPQTYEYEHDFSMTIINDWHGTIYEAFSLMMTYFGGKSTVDSGLTLEIEEVSERGTIPGMKIKLYGVRFKNITPLNFSYTDTGISTFGVSAGAIFFKTNDQIENIEEIKMNFFESFGNIGN